MAVDYQKQGKTGIITLHGKLNIGASVDDFKNAWNQAVVDGCRNLVVDLSDVPSIDSSGMGTLVRCYTIVNSRGGQMKVVGANAPHVQHVLHSTRIDTVLEFSPDANSALQSFAFA